MITPYYCDELVTLYHGDYREILPALDLHPDLVIADPPYGETALDWDTWPEGWPAAMPGRSLWCFGSSVGMFMDRAHEFHAGGWRYSHEVIWEKHNGSGAVPDRFRKVHEIATHWYRGPWGEVYHQVPTTPDATARKVRRQAQPAHWGRIGASDYQTEDGGPRLMRSVVYARSMHGRSINETEKSPAIVEPLILYGCPPGGLVLDPTAGSCSTLVAARALGRRAIGIEKREAQCEAAVTHRLTQGVLVLG